MKRHLCLLLFLALPAGVFAQLAAVDSMYFALQKTKDSKEKAKLYHKIVASTWDFDFEKAYQFANEEYELAKKIDDTESKTIALTDLGMYYYFTGNYKAAGNYYKQALREAGENNFGEYPAYTITRIGNLFRVQGEFDSAKFYYRRTEAFLKKTPPGIAQASLFFHYGWMSTELSEFSKALSYLYRARDIRYVIGDSLLIAECWRVIATAHIGLNNTDSAKYYLNKTMAIAKHYGDNELVIFANINQGDLYYTQRKTIEAIRSYEKALELLSEHNFKRYKALALFHVGKVFDSRGDFLKAIEYYLKALKINEELKNKQEIASIYGWIGWAHSNLHNYASAYEYANKSLVLMKEMNDKAGVAFSHNLLGFNAFAQKKYPSALLHYDSALQLRKSLGLEFLVVNTLNNIAKTYELQKRYDEALKNYFYNLEEAKKTDNHRIMALSNNSIGMIYSYKKNFKLAEYYLKESSQLLKQSGVLVDIRDNYLGFARMYQLSGRSAMASEYYEKYITLNDSVVNQENSLFAIQRDALYLLDKKEKEIESLSSENDLKKAEIEVQQSRIRSQNVMLIFGLFFLVLMAVIVYVLFTYYKSKSKANVELSKLNKEIHEQKEEIQAQSEELIEASQTIHEINKGLESAVEERTVQLKQAYQELDTFIYRSSHDFRRPLTTFMGLAEVAKISVKDVAALELFNKVNDTAINLDRMLTKLQEVSQMGSSELVYREVSLNNELDFVLDYYRSAILEKRIRVERNVDLPRLIASYPLIVRVLLENLIENSIQFSSPIGAYIRITIREIHHEVEIIIEDNGEGIPKEFHNRIFDMYFRGSEKSKGNGLGLYLVMKAVVKLNARIEFESEPHLRTIFRVFIPTT